MASEKVKVDVEVEFEIEYDADNGDAYEDMGDNVTYTNDLQPFCFIRHEGIIIGKRESKEWVTTDPRSIADEVQKWDAEHYNPDGQDITLDDEQVETYDLRRVVPEGDEPYTIIANGYAILASDLDSTTDDWRVSRRGNCRFFTFDYDKETTQKWDTATDTEKAEWLRCAKEEVDMALRFESGDWWYETIIVKLGAISDVLGGIQSDDKDWHEGGSELKAMCEGVLEQFIEKHS